MRKSYIYILVILLFASVNSSAQKKALKYLALGDSYTIGESVKETERYPVQLADLLNKTKWVKKQYGTVSNPTIIARTGWTTNELADAIKAKNVSGTFGLVTLLIGVNNQYRGYPIAQYEKEFAELLATALKYAGGKAKHVVAISIPDYGVTPFAADRDKNKIATELDAYNAMAKGICQKNGIEFVNITDISRMAAVEPSLVAGDGLHPSGSMYSQWAREILPVITKNYNTK